MADLRKKVEVVIDGKDRSAKAANAATVAMKKLGAAAKTAGIAIAAAGTAAAAAFAKIAKDNIDAFDKLAKVSGKIGVSVENLSALAHAAELSGVNQDTLNMALQRFSRRVAEAANGSGVLAEVMEEQGIALRDSNGQMRDTTAILDDYADAIQNAGSDQERLLLAFKAFDSEGAALVNMLKNGSGALREMTGEAHRLGIVIDATTAKKAEEFNDQLTRLRGSLKGTGVVLTAEFLPALTRLADRAVEVSQRFNEWRNESGELEKGIREAMMNADTAFRTVTGTLQDLWNGMRAIWEVFNSVGMIIGQVSALIVSALNRRIQDSIRLFQIWRDYMGDVLQTAKMLGWAIVNVADSMAMLATGNTKGIQAMRQSLVSIGKQFDKLAVSFKDSFVKTSEVMANTLERDMEEAVNGVRNLFGDLKSEWKEFGTDVGMFPSRQTLDSPERTEYKPGEIPKTERPDFLPKIDDDVEKFKTNIASAQSSVESFGDAAKKSFGQAASSISSAVLNAQNLAQAATSAGMAIVQTFIDLGIRRVIDGALMKGQAAAGVAAMSGVTAANVSSAAATAAAWSPAAAAVSLATFGANSVPANAGLISTFGLAQSLSAIGKLSSVVLGQAHDGVIFPRSGSYLMNVQKGEQIIPRTPGQTTSSQSSGPTQINIQLGPKTLARGVVDAVRGGILNLKISNNQRVVPA